MSRLDEIKVRYVHGWPSSNRRLADVGWLIAEVERLEAERASFIADAATALAELMDSAAGAASVARNDT